jgi:hypothetical protein
MKTTIRALATTLLIAAAAGLGQAKTIPFHGTTVPAGATVRLDGRVVGTTPLVTQVPGNWLSPGVFTSLRKPVTMTVSKDGYATKCIVVTDGPYHTSGNGHKGFDFVLFGGTYYQLCCDSWHVILYKPVEFIQVSSGPVPASIQAGDATTGGPPTDSAGSPGAETGLANGLLSREQVVARAMPAVVAIRAGGTYGTGFFISDCIVVTSRGVVGSATAATVITNRGQSLSSVSIYLSPNRDLAFIKVAGSGYPYLHLASGASIVPGAEVVALGSPDIPQGVTPLAGTVTQGTITAVRNTKSSGWFLETGCPADAGNTGGPLLNLRGEVTGVNTTDILAFSDGTGVQTDGGPFQPDSSAKQPTGARFAVMSGEVLVLLKEQFKMVPGGE